MAVGPAVDHRRREPLGGAGGRRADAWRGRQRAGDPAHQADLRQPRVVAPPPPRAREGSDSAGDATRVGGDVRT